jgi:hypothetical protein
MYDIIGDVHGYASLLKKLLTELGYSKTESGYFHPERKAIFTGDFINRGPEIRKTINIIRSMVENGNAYAILGNHEVNAIIYYLKFKKINSQSKVQKKYCMTLLKTIDEFTLDSDELISHLKWLRSLPLFFEMEGIRIVHACWSQEAINFFKIKTTEGKIKKKLFMELIQNPKSDFSKHIWTLTKGVDFKMPNNLKLINNKGICSRSFRLRWWEDPLGKTFEELSFDSKFILPSYTVPEQLLPETFIYPTNAPVLFIGHYCRFNGPHIIKSNICCVDSGVAESKKIVAYRWSGEKSLLAENLISIGRKK